MHLAALGCPTLETPTIQPIRVGMIGCGYWGEKLARVFSDLQGVQVSAICDQCWHKQPWIVKQYPQTQFFVNYRDLLTGECDAVVIATPAESHYSIAKACLEAGKHVFVEKPLALCRLQAESLTELAQSKNLRLFVGHVFEFDPAIHQIQQVVKSGILGEIYYIDSTRSNLGLLRLDVNILWDLLIHDISVLHKILDELPTQVSAFGSCHVTRGKQNICESAQVHMVLPQGLRASARASWLEPVKSRQLKIIGSRKALLFDPTKAQAIYLYDSGIDLDMTDEGLNIAYRQGSYDTLRYPNVEPLKVEATTFVHSILNSETTNAQAAVEITQVLEAMQFSLENQGQWTSVDRLQAGKTLGLVP